MLKTLFDDVTGINFRFRPLVTWSSPHGHDASSHKIWCRYLYAVRSYWQFSEIFRIFRLWEFGHSDVLIVWHLCSVPNWVKIYAVVTEIDDLCIRRLFDDVTPINFRFRLLVAFSSPHGRDAYSCKIWCRYLYPVRSYWHFFRNSRWRPPPSWIFRLCEFGHSCVLVVWYLCSVPNLVKIPVIVTVIDAHMLQTFIWWRHAN